MNQLPREYNQNIEGDENYAAQGDNSQINQGNNNNQSKADASVTVIVNSSDGSLNPSSDSPEQECNIHRLGGCVNKDAKYNGELVVTDLEFFRESENSENQEIGLVLDIAFAEKEVEIPRRFGKKNYLRFGIKRGKLCLSIQNGSMPLNQRQFTEDLKKEWLIETTGNEEDPVWIFQAKPSLSKILRGLRQNQSLGYIKNLSHDCTVIATFEVKVNSNNIEITAQDGLWENETTSRKEIETKTRLFITKYLEPTLKDYLSKVELRYDSTSIC